MGYYLYLESESPIRREELEAFVDDNDDWIRIREGDSTRHGSSSDELDLWNPQAFRWEPGLSLSGGRICLNGRWTTSPWVVEALARLMGQNSLELRGESGERYEIRDMELIVVESPVEDETDEQRQRRREQAFEQSIQFHDRAHSLDYCYIDACFDRRRWDPLAAVDWLKSAFPNGRMMHADWHDISAITPVGLMTLTKQSRADIVYDIVETSSYGDFFAFRAGSVPVELVDSFTRLPGLFFWSTGYGPWFDEHCAPGGHRLPSEDLIDFGQKLPCLRYRNGLIKGTDISGGQIVYYWLTGFGNKVDLSRDLNPAGADQPMGYFNVGPAKFRPARHIWFHADARQAMGLPSKLGSGPPIGDVSMLEHEDGSLEFEFDLSVHSEPKELWYALRRWVRWVYKRTQGAFSPIETPGKQSGGVILTAGTKVGGLGDFDILADVRVDDHNGELIAGKVRGWKLVEHDGMSTTTTDYIEKLMNELRAEIDAVLAARARLH